MLKDLSNELKAHASFAAFGALTGTAIMGAIAQLGHILFTTWVSLFHMTMTFGERMDMLTSGFIAVSLFLAVWIPCCTCDIVFPLPFAAGPSRLAHGDGAPHPFDAYTSGEKRVS